MRGARVLACARAFLLACARSCALVILRASVCARAQACGDTLRNADVTRVDGAAERAVTALLRVPLTARGDVLTLLGLAHYPGLMTYLPLASRREVIYIDR